MQKLQKSRVSLLKNTYINSVNPMSAKITFMCHKYDGEWVQCVWVDSIYWLASAWCENIFSGHKDFILHEMEGDNATFIHINAHPNFKCFRFEIRMHFQPTKNQGGVSQVDAIIIFFFCRKPFCYCKMYLK